MATTTFFVSVLLSTLVDGHDYTNSGTIDGVLYLGYLLKTTFGFDVLSGFRYFPTIASGLAEV
ncbi:hypothetical protein EG327_009198 [Venturia inaequalis]|uniref:Uncharacterized protein n=1 Tax=Venturia inaequalis TaxID=5025 RepID=A0A8H3VT27_VENIN|nr:hypothetical protein EG327_009198 [Venturia inaequalis]